MHKQIFVKLAVNDLSKSKTFFESLGRRYPQTLFTRSIRRRT